MLANFLNKSKPINFVGLLLFFIINFAVVFLSNDFTNNLGLYPLVYFMSLVVLFVGIFFIFNFIISKNRLTFDNSYAYFLFTLLNISLLKDLIHIKTLLVLMLYLLFLRKIYSLRSYKNTIKKLFDGGFWLGILFLLDATSILFFLLFYVAIYLYQKLTIHSLLVPILGFFVPIVIYGTYLFWFDKLDHFFQNKKLLLQFTILDIKQIWFVVGVFALATIALFYKSIRAIRVSNLFRKSWLLIALNFLLGIFCLYFTTSSQVSQLIYFLFPASIIITNGIELISNRLILNIMLLFFLFTSLFFVYNF